MPQSRNLDQSQLVVLARYPKGHYRRCVNPNWHVYADLTFLNNEDGKKSAQELAALLKGQGIKTKVEYRGAISGLEGDDNFTAPSACLEVVTKDIEVKTYLTPQNPVDAALVELYDSLDPDVIAGLGEGSMGYDAPLGLRLKVIQDITVHRSRYTKPSMNFRLFGNPYNVNMVGGTVYSVWCAKYGTPVLKTIKARVGIEPRLVFGKYVSQANRWITGYVVKGGFEMGFSDTDWGNVSHRISHAPSTAKASVDDCIKTLARYVMLELIKIRDVSQ